MSPQRAALAVLAGIGYLLLSAAPAAAHPGGVQAATDFRTTVQSIVPAVAGLTVRFVADGSRLELRNDTGRTVEVTGYEREPLLQVRPDGVWQNTRSPSLYIDTPGDPGAAGANASAPPQWQRVSDRPLARWHDHRVVWHGKPPPIVSNAPRRSAHILDWAVPLRDDGHDVRVTGSLDWLPPPATTNWWTGILLAAAALAALGLIRAPGGSRSGTWVRSVLAGASITVGLAGLGYAAAVTAHNALPGAGGFALGLVNEAWPVLTGLASIAAGTAALAQRPAADFALALAGACTALMAGIGDAAVFAHPVAPISASGTWARWAIAVVLAGALGVLVASATRLYRESTPPRPAVEPSDEPPAEAPTEPSDEPPVLRQRMRRRDQPIR